MTALAEHPVVHTDGNGRATCPQVMGATLDGPEIPVVFLFGIGGLGDEMFARELTTIDTVLLVVGAILVIGSALYLLDRLLLWMEHRGWVYWRKTKRSTGPGVGNALLEIQTLMEPSVRHVLEYRQEVKDESPEPADPPPEDLVSDPLEDTDTQ